MAGKKMSKKKVDDEMSKKKSHEEEVVKDEAAEATPEAVEETGVDELAKMQEEIGQLNDKYLRLNAEFQNYRKRVEKEKNDIFKFGTEKLMIEMLPIMDNFERALQASAAENMDSKVLDGIIMIKKSLDEFFDRNGVKKIEALGMPFDPIKHHAVMTVEAEDGKEDHVTEVFQDGYELNDKVIRPSMVKVSH